MIGGGIERRWVIATGSLLRRLRLLGLFDHVGDIFLGQRFELLGGGRGRFLLAGAFAKYAMTSIGRQEREVVWRAGVAGRSDDHQRPVVIAAVDEPLRLTIRLGDGADVTAKRIVVFGDGAPWHQNGCA